LSRYTADLVIPEKVAAECALLKALAAHYVMRRPGTDERLAGQRRTLRELASALVESAPDGLGSVARAAWAAAADDAGRLRAVVDQVAQLTDSAAVAWHAGLRGRPGVVGRH
jgi:dGTPase